MKRTMTPCKSICIYCSVLNGIEPTLIELRRLQPDAEITAIVPPGYVWREATPCPADEVIPATFGFGALLRPVEGYRFIVGLRRKRFDLVLTLFESIRLRLFAVLVHPKEAISWLPTAEMRPMSTCLVTTLLDLARLRATGYGRVFVALLHAFVLPNKPKVKLRR